MPDHLKKTIENIRPELFEKSEQELEELLRPAPLVSRLRMEFWKEYEAAQAGFRRIDLIRISNNLSIPLTNVSTLMRRVENMAWILCPPTTYNTVLEEALSYGIRRVRNDILTIGIHNPDGSVDPKKADILLKAVAFIDMRKNGAVVQKSLHLHANAGPKEVKKFSDQVTMAEIDARIKELEQKGTISAAERSIKALEEAEIIPKALHNE